MTETLQPFTIESFYKFVREGKLMGAKCNNCGQLLVPPKPMCSKCFSKDLRWNELPKRGLLLTYTVIHIAPIQFQTLAPYAVGIVEFGDGAQLPGMISDIDLGKIKVGMNLSVEFDKEVRSEEWPQWPRYHFKPVQPK